MDKLLTSSLAFSPHHIAYSSLATMENKERIVKPKPKMTKAERRELQEKQRAAKAAAKSSTEKHGVGLMPTSNSRHGQSNAPLHVPNTGKTSAQVFD